MTRASRVRLHMHVDNARAPAAYRRAGFSASGGTFTGTIGPEIELARDLAAHPGVSIRGVSIPGVSAPNG